MPARFSIDPNKNSIVLQFLDANDEPISEPAGAQVDWTIDNDNVATVTPNTNNQFESDIVVRRGGAATITATITGADDVNGQPYQPVTAFITATPAQAASLMFGPTG